jgi:hypothetical protein
MTGNASAQVNEVIIPNKNDNDGIILLLRLLHQTQLMVTGNASAQVIELIIPNETDGDGKMLPHGLLK